MAYTADDLASGARVAMVVKDGRTVQYAQADINKLRELERSIAGSLKATAGRSRTRYAVTSKGL